MRNGETPVVLTCINTFKDIGFRAPMEKKYGSTRVAYVGKNWTIKRPLLHTNSMLSGSLAPVKNVFRGRFRNAKWFFTKGADADESLLWCLGQEGWRENHREIKAWKELGNLVFPTRSLIGNLLVCQRTTRDVSLSTKEMWKFINDTSLDINEILASSRIAHTLECSDNYGFWANSNRVCLRDYGGEGVSEFLLKNRSGIIELLEKLFSESSLNNS